ncbi:MAG: amino acid adenylation domain-containing protein, partial [Pseudonocardiaceae bacterium]
VRNWAGSRLPAQLVPALIVTIDALPRTPGGKLDRRALPAPHLAPAAASRPPRTDLERTLCDLFGEVLQRTGVGIDDGFFALGGHSLLALRLVNRIRSVLRVDVPVAELFTAPTVAELACAVENAPAVAAAPLTPRQRPPALPLSGGQRQIWGLVQVEGPAPTYNVPRVWHVHGGLDTAALQAAACDVVDRHEVLRTTYRQAGDEVTQCVHDVAELPPYVRLCPVSRAELDARTAAAVRHCFDLRRESPVRLDVFTLTPDEHVPDEHVVVLTVHHIAVDEWSYRVLLRDLSAAYAARVRGAVPEFDPLPVQYADFALWQRDLLGAAADPGSRAARQLEYWAQALAGAAPETTFPLDRPRPELPSGRGAAVEFEIGPEVTSRLLELADEHQVTMFMLMHTVVAVLLGKHGVGEDIVIGSPISQRRDDALDGLVGFFLNTLALRVDLSGNPTVAELLTRVKATDLTAMRHQDIPFEQVVERLNPERSAARNPLFQVEVVYLRTDLEHSEVSFTGTTARPSRVGTGTAKFDAGFQFFEGGSAEGGRRIQGVLEYAVDLFDEASMRSVLDRLHRLLELFVADPHRHLSETRILSSGDQLRLLDRREAMPALPDRPRMLCRVFEDAVAARPDAVALVAGTQRLTYRELDQRANQVARLLLSRGCRPGTRVGIGVPRSAEMVVALLGVLKAGGSYVPVDVSAPAERLALVLDEAGPLCVLTTDAVRAAFARVSVPLLVLDAAPVAEELAGLPGSAPEQPLDAPGQPAYVIYTSGSTGRPKGVEVSHASVTDLVAAAAAKFDFGADDVWTLFHSVAFDVSVFEMWGAFSHAARLVVVDHATTRAPDQLWALVAGERVSVLSQTPSAFYQLTEAEPDGSGHADSLRYVVFAGEALEMRRLRGWYERHAEDAPRLINMYGITETTVHTTYRALERTVCDSPASPVGGPLPGLGIYLLDQQLNMVPPGVAGELYVAGGQLAQGYAERPALTSTRFVANPFSDRGERLYRSGDLARWNCDGELEFAGRSDDQVKLRGYRIELGEVETALLACPGVSQAVAMVRADIPDHRQLVGYVIPAEGELDADAIRAALAATLPEYMVPAALVELDHIPLTINGKLDRRALPAPQFTSQHTSRSPRNDTEHILCQTYAAALNLDEVGVDDDFFALGGDSILAIQVVNRAGRKNVLISARDIFRVKTPAALAELAVVVDDSEVTTDAAEPTHIPPLPIVHRLAEFSGSIRRYNQSMLVEFPADRSVDALAAALQAVIDRHDALRQRLTRAGQGYWALEATPAGSIRAADVLRHVTVPEFMPDGGMQTLAKESDAATDRLDPAAGVMLQAVSATAQDEEHGLLLLVVHHLAVDAVSWLVLLDDLEQAWLDAGSGEPPQVAPVRTSLAEFGRIVTEQAHSKRFLAEYEHWQRVLAPGAELLSGFGGGSTLAGVAHEVVAAPPALTRSLLADLPQRGGSDLTEVLLAALLRTVSSWRRRTGAGEPVELAVDVERHGREELVPGLDLSRTVGWFTTVAPVRLTASTDRDALLEGVRRSFRSTAEAGIGFGMLRYLHPQTAPRMARLARPQILFNYLGRFDLNSRVVPFGDPRRNALRTDPDPDMEMPYSLEVNVMVAPGSDGSRLEARFSAPREALTTDDMAVISHEWLESLTWLTNTSE